MPHPNDITAEGTCRECGVRLSKVIDRGDNRLYRRHLEPSPDCPAQGRGEQKP